MSLKLFWDCIGLNVIMLMLLLCSCFVAQVLLVSCLNVFFFYKKATTYISVQKKNTFDYFMGNNNII